VRIEIRITGIGGQGAITIGHILGRAAVIYDKKEAVVTEGYSPYITGGWSRADVVISDRQIDYPLVSRLDALLTMYQEGLTNNLKFVKQDGVILVERNLVDSSKAADKRVFEIPGLAIAEKLGRKILLNVVMLGALTRATNAVSPEAVKRALADRFPKAAELNAKAFDEGYSYVDKLVSEGKKGVVMG